MWGAGIDARRMKYLITGLGGTLAPRLAEAALARGCMVVGWDRVAVDPEDAGSGIAWLESVRPDAIFHLAMGSVEWSARLATFAEQREIPLVYTSSAMVFHHEPDGPHRIESDRTAQDAYGKYKITCEDAILRANPVAVVARIGWQIDPTHPGNNMLAALDEWQQRDGCVGASRVWLPACSFMEDTAAALLALANQRASGLFHLDSNAVEGHTFARIVGALKERFGREHWVVRENEDYRHDQRLVGNEPLMPELSLRLPL